MNAVKIYTLPHTSRQTHQTAHPSHCPIHHQRLGLEMQRSSLMKIEMPSEECTWRPMHLATCQACPAPSQRCFALPLEMQKSSPKKAETLPDACAQLSTNLAMHRVH